MAIVLFAVFPGASPWAHAAASASTPIRYSVSLARPAAHLVHVTIALPPGPDDRQLQLPVWNALYQVRDFSQYLNWVRAQSGGLPLKVRELDKSRWLVQGTGNGAQVEYEIMADDSGPYGAQLNAQHAFFNLAEILMYPVEARSAAMRVRFDDVPAGWHLATVLPVSAEGEISAENYDRLVDSPVELGTFQESDFDEGGGHYRVVVDANRSDYDMQQIVPMVRKIVAAETKWMDDRPFQTYMFLYHFPRGPGGGGMEHAFCTAIDVTAQELASDSLALPDVSAHEFFHLWNVKRIRPQTLEPVDYTRENYTRALWFSEGVTSTVEDYTLLSTGMLDEAAYLKRLAAKIAELERRPAHLTQSAEESSLDAWLEKYSAYWVPQRSISYYNKGDLLGVLLDLEVREASQGKASLRDVFRWMNDNYARKGVFFPDSEGVRRAAEAVSHADLLGFFQKYVAGTEEIPWDNFFRSVGLRLVRQVRTAPDLGFQASPRFGGTPLVIAVSSGSDAQQAGLQAGDTILKIDGKKAGADFQRRLNGLNIGETLRLQVQGNGGEREVEWKVGQQQSEEFELKDVENITATQKARRAAWLSGHDQN